MLVDIIFKCGVFELLLDVAFWHDGGQLFPDCKKRVENLEFIHLARNLALWVVSSTTTLWQILQAKEELLHIVLINHQMWSAIDMRVVATLVHPNVPHNSIRPLVPIIIIIIIPAYTFSSLLGGHPTILAFEWTER